MNNVILVLIFWVQKSDILADFVLFLDKVHHFIFFTNGFYKIYSVLTF